MEIEKIYSAVCMVLVIVSVILLCVTIYRDIRALMPVLYVLTLITGILGVIDDDQ